MSTVLGCSCAFLIEVSDWVALRRSCRVRVWAKQLFPIERGPQTEDTVWNVLRWKIGYNICRVIWHWLLDHFELTSSNRLSWVVLLWCLWPLVSHSFYLFVICWLVLRCLHVSRNVFVHRLRAYSSGALVCCIAPRILWFHFLFLIAWVFLASLDGSIGEWCNIHFLCMWSGIAISRAIVSFSSLYTLSGFFLLSLLPLYLLFLLRGSISISESSLKHLLEVLFFLLSFD